MPVVRSDIHTSLQHDDRKWYPGNPAHEAYDGKDCKERKDDTSSPEMFVQVVYRRSDCEGNVQYTCNPDELLRKCSCSQEICPGKDQRDTEDESEQDESIGVEREVVASVVDATTTEAFVLAVFLDRDSRDGYEAEENENELLKSVTEFSKKATAIPGFLPTGHCILASRS